MTDAPRYTASARALIILLALALIAMLGVSLKNRFQNPHLTVTARQQATQAPDGAPDIGALMRQVSENPQDINALIHLIEHLISAQNWKAAETFAQRAVTMDVNNPKPLYLLGVIMHSEGRHKEAATALEQVLKIKDEASVRYSLGILYMYFLDDPKRGMGHLNAGLRDPEAGEAIKAAIRQELEKPAAPESDSTKSPAPGKKTDATPKKSVK